MRTLLSRLPAFLFAFAAASGLLASLLVLLTAGSTQITTTNGVITRQYLNWVESQGWWGIAILIIYSAAYAGPWYFHRRGQRGLAALFIAIAIVLTVLASFSIGVFYWLAALAALLGGALMLLQPGS